MKVDGQELIVLEIVAESYKRAKKEVVDVAKEFFKANGGVLNNEHPLGVSFAKLKDLKKWQNSVRSFTAWNLCICSSMAFLKECQAQSYSLAQTLDQLRHVYDDIFLNVDEPWADKVMDHLQEHPADRPNRQFVVFSLSNDHKRMDEVLKRYSSWK